MILAALIQLLLIGTGTVSSTPAASIYRHHLGHIHADELFTSQVRPALFNWTFSQPEQFSYYAALAGYPDLPIWMRYMYSAEYGSGYLYGTPPARLLGQEVHIDVVAQDALTYEYRRAVCTFGVRARPAHRGRPDVTSTVQTLQMRIDNLNWVQLMDPGRVENLKNIFRHELWTESSNDLYVAFMDSAVTMGGRVPLRPQEKEGVIIHLASRAPLSARLHELQKEIRPLYKLTTCSYKRTSVQTIIDTAGFKIDWCTFRIHDGQPKVAAKTPAASGISHDDTSTTSTATAGSSSSSPTVATATEPPVASASVFHQHHFVDGSTAGPFVPMLRADAPQRNYIDELALALCVPLLVFTLLVAILTMIVCLVQGKIEYPCHQVSAAAAAVQMVQYAGGHTTTAATRMRSGYQHQQPLIALPSLQLLGAGGGGGGGDGGGSSSDSADDGNSLRSHSPCASLTRLPPVAGCSPRTNASGLLASNSTLRPRPPPYKPPTAGSFQQQQAAPATSSASSATAAGDAAAAAASVMSQSTSSRVLYC